MKVPNSQDQFGLLFSKVGTSPTPRTSLVCCFQKWVPVQHPGLVWSVVFKSGYQSNTQDQFDLFFSKVGTSPTPRTSLVCCFQKWVPVQHWLWWYCKPFLSGSMCTLLFLLAWENCLSALTTKKKDWQRQSLFCSVVLQR